MVLLVQRLSKLYSKLENHHHHHHHRTEIDVLSASLQSFRSDVSVCLNQLLLNPKPRPETLSFSFIQRCFELLPVINKAFSKLVVDIDYPMNTWEIASIDEYLNYGLHLLELLNSVSSSISHLAQSKLSLAHGLNSSLVEKNSPCLAIKHLKPIQPQSSASTSTKVFKDADGELKLNKKFSSCKERVINEALMEIKGIGFWVFGVVLAILRGETKPYLEMKQVVSRFDCDLLIGVDACVFEVIVEKSERLKEVKEVNGAVNSLVSEIVCGKISDAAMDLDGKLGDFEKKIEALEKEVDALFSKVLATRNGFGCSVFESIGN